jgi:hypothetical protein
VGDFLVKRIKLIKKWIKMLMGKSDLHVNQGIGRIYSKDKIKGYYNDLTKKVNWHGEFGKNGIPLNVKSNGDKVYFSITISQYALGNYDLYLLTHERKYYKQFKKSVDWLVNNQDVQGGWDISNVLGNKYSAMAQGEGISVLARAFIKNKNNKYLNSAIKATELMIKPINNGGTARHISNNIYFEEYVNVEPSLILNGWIFAIFGLFDITKLTDDIIYKNILSKTLKTLENELDKYDIGYWSYYDQCGHLSSPFYHKLHIAQLDVLYDLFEIGKFKSISDKWKLYLHDRFKMNKAIILKVWQKIREPGEIIIIK